MSRGVADVNVFDAMKGHSSGKVIKCVVLRSIWVS